jgi:acetoin utilization protein AcuB
MKSIPPIKSAMTPFPYAIDIDASVTDARALMQAHDIQHLPVTAGRELIGIVTRRDIDGRARNRSKRESTVRDVYTPEPYLVELDEPLDNVLVNMAARRIGSAIVTRKGRLAGVFTATDACRCFAEYLREHFRPRGGSDAA